MDLQEEMEYNKYTYADLLTWEGPRCELIEGEPKLLASPTRVHQTISRKLFLQIANYLEGKSCEVFYSPFDVRLFEKENDGPKDVDTVVQPDIFVVCDPKKLDDSGCKGAPDLVVEIISPFNREHDTVTKFDLYQRAGVKEYWIIDPEARIVQVYTLEKGRYHAAAVYTREQSVPVGVLEGCSVELGLVFPQEK